MQEVRRGPTVDGEVAQGSAGGSLDLDVGTLQQEENGLEGIAIDLSNIWTCISVLGSRDSRGDDAAAPRSVISANVKLALLWRSMFSENTKVLRARRGSPEKKSISPRCSRVRVWETLSKSYWEGV